MVPMKPKPVLPLTHDYAKERPNDEFELIIRRDGFDLALLNYGNEIWHGLVGRILFNGN